jgi:hypothetical protein
MDSLALGQDLYLHPQYEQNVTELGMKAGNSPQSFAQRTWGHEDLDRALERPQLTGITLPSYNYRPILTRSSGIAFSGTVGIGIWTNTGALISISGSAGCVIAYAVSAFFVTSVMRCLGEMVSVRPFSGALMDFPSTFVDPGLGFAVGVTYWYFTQMEPSVLTVKQELL